jgi:hypothetical protein
LLAVKEGRIGLAILEETAIEWNFTHEVTITYQIAINCDSVCIVAGAAVGFYIERIVFWA